MNKIYSIFGLCMRAGKVASGADVCIENIKKGSAFLIIVAEDASPKTLEKFEYFSKEYDIKLVVCGEIDGLSKAIGKDNKAIFTILDEGFSKKIIELVEELKGAI